MRDRNSCVRRCRDAGGHARNYFEWNSRGRQSLRLFAAAAEHERVATLEANNTLAGLRERNERLVDEGLLRGFRGATAFADIHKLGAAGPRRREKRGIGQRVVHDRVAIIEELA